MIGWGYKMDKTSEIRKEMNDKYGIATMKSEKDDYDIKIGIRQTKKCISSLLMCVSDMGEKFFISDILVLRDIGYVHISFMDVSEKKTTFGSVGHIKDR